MDYQLYGFLIGKEIHFDFGNKRLYRLPQAHLEKDIIFSMIYLNDTMLHFLFYLLTHARHRYISKDEILKSLWEDKSLSPSTQRLSQVLKGLKSKLGLLGLADDFILNTKKSGYRINHPDIIPFYSKVNEFSMELTINLAPLPS